MYMKPGDNGPFPYPIPPGFLGYAYNCINGYVCNIYDSGYPILYSDIYISQQYYGLCTGNPCLANLQNTAAHEIGHGLLLDHHTDIRRGI